MRVTSLNSVESGPLFNVGWRVLRLYLQETASVYARYLQMYWN